MRVGLFRRTDDGKRQKSDTIGNMNEHPDDIRAMRYVIYVRKSTDDPQKQVRSIDDQIIECEELAKRAEKR